MIQRQAKLICIALVLVFGGCAVLYDYFDIFENQLAISIGAGWPSLWGSPDTMNGKRA